MLWCLKDTYSQFSHFTFSPLTRRIHTRIAPVPSVPVPHPVLLHPSVVVTTAHVPIPSGSPTPPPRARARRRRRVVKPAANPPSRAERSTPAPSPPTCPGRTSAGPARLGPDERRVHKLGIVQKTVPVDIKAIQKLIDLCCTGISAESLSLLAASEAGQAVDKASCSLSLSTPCLLSI